MRWSSVASSRSAGNGHDRPAAASRFRYRRTVPLPTEQILAICRSFSLASKCSLSISCTGRIGNLFSGTCSPSLSGEHLPWITNATPPTDSVRCGARLRRCGAPLRSPWGTIPGMWGMIPLTSGFCPTSQRNRAPHHNGILPHFKRNQCPTWTGILIQLPAVSREIRSGARPAIAQCQTLLYS